MLDFWNNAAQYISDVFTYDEKTTDVDYQHLCDKMTNIEAGITSLKTILKEHKIYVEPFCQYIKTLNESIKKIYDDSPLKGYIDNIIIRHELVLKEIQDLSKKLNKLNTATSEWNTIFKKAKESIKIREEKRKNFDYYEQKLLKIDKNKKKIKEFVQRNQEKYNLSSKEYIEASQKSFEVIKSSIKLSWELTSPIVGDIIVCEKNFFEVNSSHLYEFSTIIYDFKEIMMRAFNPELNKDKQDYDPKKYIKSQKLRKKKEHNYQHTFTRKTNTFGKLSSESQDLFLNIKDKVFNIDKEQN